MNNNSYLLYSAFIKYSNMLPREAKSLEKVRLKASGALPYRQMGMFCLKWDDHTDEKLKQCANEQPFSKNMGGGASLYWLLCGITV